LRKLGLVASAGLLLTCSTAVAAMNAEVFYKKATALEQQGAAAAISSDLQPVMNAVKSASAAVKAENEAAKKRGKPLFCVPENNRMSSKQALNELRLLGPSKRKSMDVKQAFRTIMIKKYPCK
jgi:hypothetical protein